MWMSEDNWWSLFSHSAMWIPESNPLYQIRLQVSPTSELPCGPTELYGG